MAVTAQKVERQPKARPSHAPNGTPSRVARVRPVNMMAMAEALRSGGTSETATSEPTPKKVPWARAVMIRAPISMPKVGARAATRLPRVKMAISAKRVVLGGRRRVARVRIGAPTKTPSA